MKPFQFSRFLPVLCLLTTVAAANNPYPEWSHHRRIIINSSSTGYRIGEGTGDFPLIIRLSTSNFNFDEVQGAGEDLRFSTAADEPLPVASISTDAEGILRKEVVLQPNSVILLKIFP